MDSFQGSLWWAHPVSKLIQSITTGKSWQTRNTHALHVEWHAYRMVGHENTSSTANLAQLCQLSQIDHSTQGKPLKKASRRPREQNASLYGLYRNRPTREAGRPPRADWVASTWADRVASITRRQTPRRGPYRPTPFVRRPHVARNTNIIFDIYLIRNLWTLLVS